MRIALLSATLLAAFLASSPLTLAATSGASQVEDRADDDFRQIPLTAKQVEGFLAGNDAVGAIVDKIPEDRRDAPDPEAAAVLDKVAAANGFKDYGEFETVASNIEFLLGGFDPETKQFIGNAEVLKQQIAATQADSELRPQAKARRLKELQSEMSDLPAVGIPANIAVVAKYYDRLLDVFDSGE